VLLLFNLRASVESGRRNGVDREAWLAGFLDRLALNHGRYNIDMLLLSNWR
jgi:hypothetical protein